MLEREPNDQYLCIVLNSSQSKVVSSADVFLLFEGDYTLAVILSKVFMLPDDSSITDLTVISQIRD